MHTNISWEHLTQSDVRRELRAATDAGTIDLLGISPGDFRTLVNGTPIDGIRLRAEDLRKIGSDMKYTHPLAKPEPAPQVVTEPDTGDLSNALDVLQKALAPKQPQLDTVAVRNLSEQTAREIFPQLFEDAAKELPASMQNAISEVVKQFSGTDLQAQASALFQTELGQQIVRDVQSGTKTILPPIRPVAGAYRENRTTKAIQQQILSCFHIIISGPSGSGKTFPLEQVLNKLGRRWMKISCADGLSMSELLAEKTIEVEDGSPVMKVVLKALPICIREGIVLILDEADQLAGEILAMFNAATDCHPARITVPQTGEVIEAHRDFLVALTMNGLTDETGLYSGHQISGALKTRCRFVYADYLTKREEVAILEADGLSTDNAGAIVDKFRILRKAHTAGTLTMPPSTRTMLSISKSMQGKNAFGDNVQELEMQTLEEAMQSTVLDALPPSERSEVVKLLSL